MKFRTELRPVRAALTLRPDLPIGLLGSCFADNMVRRMRDCLWNASNPLGVLFNPLSIARALETYIFSNNPADDWGSSLFEADGLTHSWLADSSATTADPEKSLELFSTRSAEIKRIIDRGRTLCVTFGTSYCYFLRDRKKYVVANCHKQPSDLFIRRRAEQEEIVEVWSEIIEKLSVKYPGLNIIFTVSPVRHVRDGLHENTLSKAILHLSIDTLRTRFDNCHYFPAYELVTDDLRDYRFYATDMVHPSETAVEYIWEYFTESFLDALGKQYIKEGEALAKRLRHRPILDGGNEYAVFQQETEKRLDDFCRRYGVSVQI